MDLDEGMSVMKNKVFLSSVLVIMMTMSLGVFFIQPILVYATDTEEVEDNTIESMDELGVDLVDDFESADSVETDDEIVSVQEDLEVSVFKNEAKVNVEQSGQEQFAVSIDDKLDYVENEDGMLVYQSEEQGYSVNAQPLDGGARFLFNIESESSAKRFKIDFTIEDGGYLTKDENGDFYIADADGEAVVLIGRAWAVDSEGTFVETFYEQEGNSIYQVINYSGDKYPLTADPLFCSDTIDNNSTTYNDNKMSGKYKGIFYVYARTCAKLYINSYWISMAFTKKINLFPNALIAKDMWNEVVADASFVNSPILKRNRARVKDQFLCHAMNLSTIWKASWNLEPRRPDVSLKSTYQQLCNPK
ncbi:DUF2599 domain-containing protein [Listeria innocua]|uniref:DUF2599 domain-containing protein n=1 Tax=Listeria innocua TaxID=1642 RepID=UPI0016260B20|nr:DUF2599 domain-containing protein [Listeria innocua]